ncbi:MAG: 2-oxoacid:acceptor oxidoreductase family protein [Deltaproteobacteria bacterium]|nr:MAG: 2-oxoacid:acceptor oxidoreductase family protein [Deltaproteobacteria bacterium]
MSRTEIKIGGFGGQGVILTALIIGKAASLFEGRESTMTQSFGPEARGGACSAQIVVSDMKVRYPYVTVPNVLVVMSQEAYTRFEPQLDENGILLIEEDLVKSGPTRGKIRAFSIPATRFAEELGRKIVLNIVMLGFFTSVTKLVDADAVRKAIRDTVPKGTEELNLKAFEKGYEYGLNKLKEEKKKLG